ncbi:hypothetical protein BDQ17DRAFT_164626 [Cyathus striatus]|nr:hypothetical protein BDQ17DRAFT_164626 [Cyathus striatus]
MLRAPALFGASAQLLRPRPIYSTRLYATSNLNQANGLPKPDHAKANEEDKDFRPPWVYTASRLTNFVLIPATFLYAAFVYDWGEHDHVFQPFRRWAMEQKQTYFVGAPSETLVLATPPSLEPAEEVASTS